MADEETVDGQVVDWQIVDGEVVDEGKDYFQVKLGSIDMAFADDMGKAFFVEVCLKVYSFLDLAVHFVRLLLLIYCHLLCQFSSYLPTYDLTFHCNSLSCFFPLFVLKICPFLYLSSRFLSKLFQLYHYLKKIRLYAFTLILIFPFPFIVLIFFLSFLFYLFSISYLFQTFCFFPPILMIIYQSPMNCSMIFAFCVFSTLISAFFMIMIMAILVIFGATYCLFVRFVCLIQLTFSIVVYIIFWIKVLDDFIVLQLFGFRRRK